MNEGFGERRELSAAELIAESWQTGRLTLLFPETAPLVEERLASQERFRSLLLALRDHDSQWAHHSIRAAHAAADIARELGKSQPELALLTDGALLHDIGKIKVPLAILRKAGKLTPDEWEDMQNHVRDGLEMLPLEDYPDPEGLMALVGGHHEQKREGPYPRANHRSSPYDELLHILSVSEVFDGLRNPRSYHEEYPPEVVREMILEELTVDPGLIDLVLKRY